MFIQTEPTPNPATLKFLPGREVMSRGTADFADAGSARTSPLAERLFAITGVTGVFLGSDFVTVAKNDAEDWQVIKECIRASQMKVPWADFMTDDMSPTDPLKLLQGIGNPSLSSNSSRTRTIPASPSASPGTRPRCVWGIPTCPS